MPLVSVIVPMRNAAPYVRAALESILGQTSVDLEVVVVNDGSTDGSERVVAAIQDTRIRLISGPCQGIAAALNTGLAAVTGELIARCDADDLFAKGRLARQVPWLKAHPDFTAVCGSFSMMDPKGHRIREMTCRNAGEEITKELSSGITRTHFGTYLMHREAVTRLGGFRSYLDGCEDIDMQLRLGQTGRIWFEPVTYYHYRLHDASITHRQPSEERLFLESIVRQFALQRQTRGQDDLELGCAPPRPTSQGSVPLRSREHIQGLLIGQAWEHHSNHRRLKALRIGWQACLVRPTKLGGWRNLAVLALKRPPPPSVGSGG